LIRVSLNEVGAVRAVREVCAVGAVGAVRDSVFRSAALKRPHEKGAKKRPAGAQLCSAGFPVCGFRRLSSRQIRPIGPMRPILPITEELISMAYYGKIARLPRNIRDELNHRLDNGEPGVHLIEWLNSLTEVQKLLESGFDSRQITDQNLSKWKANGYLKWQAQQEITASSRELKEDAGQLAAESGDGELTQCLGTVVAAHYAAALHGWNGEITDEMLGKLRALKGISREVARLEKMNIQREWLTLGAKASELNQQRYEDSKRSEELKAMQCCLDHTKQYPEAMEAFKQAFDVFDKARAAKESHNHPKKSDQCCPSH